MPNRILREGILTSEIIDTLTCEEENFYRRLLSVVDDYGRYFANASLIYAQCYPLRLDQYDEAKIIAYLELLSDKKLLKLYTIDNKNYIQINNFKQRTRTDSKFPEPPCLTNDGQETDKKKPNDGLGGGVDEGGGGGGKKKTIPKDFCLTEQMIKYAEKKKVTDKKLLEAHVENFIDCCKAKNYKYADFYAAWQTWLRKDIEDGKIQTGDKAWT